MSTPASAPLPLQHRREHRHAHFPGYPHVIASLLQTVVIALFVLTFLLQPLLIPSESMERTLLVGDFLLFNKQIFAPSDWLSRWLLPYRPVERGDIVVFHHPEPPLLIKRVVGLPGDRLRIVDGQVFVNGATLKQPYAVFEPAPPDPARENFPAKVYTDPEVDPEWWHEMQSLVDDGELVVPAGDYFVLGDNRNHSLDSRYWGFVPRRAIEARPLVIYFSLKRRSTTDAQENAHQGAGGGGAVDARRAPNGRLGHERELAARLVGFARWGRIFRVVH
jgi:signal peptidase I